MDIFHEAGLAVQEKGHDQLLETMLDYGDELAAQMPLDAIPLQGENKEVDSKFSVLFGKFKEVVASLDSRLAHGNFADAYRKRFLLLTDRYKQWAAYFNKTA